MQIQNHYNLSSMNTLGLKSEAEYFAEIFTLEDLQNLREAPQFKSTKWYLLGGGSNLVLPPIINGLVVKIASKGQYLTQEDSEFWFVKAQAGEGWHDFVQWTLSQSYFGLENLSLIPGTVGAAPIQNIGAYGVEVKDFIYEVTAFNLETGDLKTFTNSECDFSYRDSYFKKDDAGKYLIWDVTFRLPKKNKMHVEYGDIKKEIEKQQLEINPLNVSKAVIAIRTQKLPDPKIIGNAGSFFKNPIVSAELHNSLKTRFPNLVSYATQDGKFKLAAGWLIEQSGWKGKKLGSVGMYEKQALVLVNHGGANSADVWNLAHQVCSDVKNQFGVDIEAEPIAW